MINSETRKSSLALTPTTLATFPAVTVTFDLWPWTLTCDLDLRIWPR